MVIRAKAGIQCLLDAGSRTKSGVSGHDDILLSLSLRLAALLGVVQEPAGLDDRPLAWLHAEVGGIGRRLGDVPQPDRLASLVSTSWMSSTRRTSPSLILS